MDTQKVILHARFAPNGSVVEISERPGALSPQGWFDFLSEKAGDVYQAFAGGRGVFRLTPDELAALKQAAAPTAS